MALLLRHYDINDVVAALAAHAELAAEDFEFLLGYDPTRPWSSFVQMNHDMEQGVNLPDGWVPAAQLGAFVDGELVGRTSIRFGFNDFLAFRGGHIGYAVRPHARRRGYATEILQQSCVIARQQGIDHVLVTCNDANIGSAAVIEACGGVLEGVAVDPADGERFRRYWIN